MQRLTLMATALVAAFLASTSAASALDDLLARQRTGLWELKPPSGSALQFCVTDQAKADARARMIAAMNGMGCRYLTDQVKGNRFEVVARCVSSDPKLGTFQIHASGTADAERWQFAAKLMGGGPTVQSFATLPALAGTVQWRRLGACRPPG